MHTLSKEIVAVDFEETSFGNLRVFTNGSDELFVRLTTGKVYRMKELDGNLHISAKTVSAVPYGHTIGLVIK